jgi:hypothetical protein
LLVGATAVFLQLHSQDERNLAQAVTDLTDKPLGALIVLVVSLVISTLVIQAFEFEVIRFFEGYWPVSGPLAWLGNWRTSRHARKKLKLRRRYGDARETGLTAALADLREERELVVVHAVEALARADDTDQYDPAAVTEAKFLDWRLNAPAEVLRRVDALARRVTRYPANHRVLPTVLGNTLRAAEDAVVERVPGDIEGFILRNESAISARLQEQHDAHRTRLDMYCTLIVVSTILAVEGCALLVRKGGGLLWPIGAALLFLVLTLTSYVAAIYSARGYGTALRAIAERVANAST